MKPRFFELTKTLAVAGLLALAVSTAQAQTPPSRTAGTLYYRVGGHDPASLAANPNAFKLRLSLGGSISLGYTCGKFNLSAMWQNYMAQISNFGDTVQDALTAVVMGFVSSLPMYILQRAQPGLYELFQTYYSKFEIAKNLAVKTCEEMEAQIAAGGNPYQDYVNMARSEYWMDATNNGVRDSNGNTVASNDDAIAVKQRVQENPGVKGMQPFHGVMRGGENQPPFRIVTDTTQAAYNVTMSQAPAAPATTVYPPNTRLTSLWNSPQDAARWATDVLGDTEISTCSQQNCGTDSQSTGKATVTALGLHPKYDAAVTSVETNLSNLVTSNNPSTAALDAVAAPGVGLTRDVIDALRRLPPGNRPGMVARLAREVALAQTIERALTLRELLSTGASHSQYQGVTTDVRARIAQLNREIDDLRSAQQIRKELVSTTASTLLEWDRQTAASNSSSVQPGAEVTPRPMTNGAVR